MNIAIIGYGRMGHEVEKIAEKRGHKVVCIIDENNQEDFNSEAFKSADVAIEFTCGDTAQHNIERCWEAGVPVVSGSTGWINTLSREWIKQNIGSNKLITSSNFSLGMNVMFAANRLISRMLSSYAYYTPRIHEVHHINKKDHPSGTAITLAEGIVEENERYNLWVEPGENTPQEGVIPVTYEREADVKGIHEVEWDAPMCTITLRHEAKNRDGFAVGAVIAAEWLAHEPEPGYYSMLDVLAEIH